MPKKYVVTITLGNASMRTAADIAAALKKAAEALEQGEAAAPILDANGNRVGRRSYVW